MNLLHQPNAFVTFTLISITARTTLDKYKRVTEAVPIYRTSPVTLAVTAEAKLYLYVESWRKRSIRVVGSEPVQDTMTLMCVCMCVCVCVPTETVSDGAYKCGRYKSIPVLDEY